jgi:hypothetical protein
MGFILAPLGLFALDNVEKKVSAPTLKEKK